MTEIAHRTEPQRSAIYDPRRHITPSQRLLADAHAARRDGMKAPAASRPVEAPPVAVAEARPEDQAKLAPPIPNSMMRAAHRHLEWSTPLNRVEIVQRAVMKLFPGITMSELRSSRRGAKIVRPRQIAMYLAKSMTPASYPEIGRRFGGRDHTTVMWAFEKISQLIKTDEQVALQVNEARAIVETELGEF